MGKCLGALGKAERAAVAAPARAEFDRIVTLQPESYVAKTAQADPRARLYALCELISGDPERVDGIVFAPRRKQQQESPE